MKKGSTLFYYKHIRNSIDKLDNRKDRHVENRLQFLTKYYKPIQQKINLIKEQIQRYQQLKNSQKKRIEEDVQVEELKKQISDYKKTNKYFEVKLDEYDQLNIQIQDKNQKLKKKIQKFKQHLKNNYHSQVARNSPEKYVLVHKNYPYKSSTTQLALETKATVLDEQNHDEEKKLPTIRRPSKYYVFYRYDKKKTQDLSVKFPSLSHNALDSSIQQEDCEESINTKKIRQSITLFDQTESLLKECFEKKKSQVQKSVSQLQSKLILNKQSFLKACQVLGEKEGSLSFEQFSSLSVEQIVTLFISFGWLNKKLYSQMKQKRKQIMKYMNKLPNL